MNHLIQNYEIILEALATMPINFQPFRQPIQPKLSNKECIALSLTAEFMSIDSENQLFRMLEETKLSNRIERMVFNRRRKLLFSLTEKVRRSMAGQLNAGEVFFIVDSMPLDICKMSSSARSSVVQGRI